MEFARWLAAHWLDILQALSVCLAAYAFWTDTMERKIGNLFALTTSHREIWSKLYEQKELSRVLSPSANLRQEPVTLEEELFVHILILHVRTAFKARELGMQFDDDAVAADIRQFFNRPIPFAVWQRSKVFQDRKFVEFVDRCIEPPAAAERAA